MELNKIYNEECIAGMDRIPDKSVDMILCDLPYGTTQCSWDTIIPFDKLWAQYERVIKDNGVIVLTGAEPFTSLLICSNLKLFKYDWIWHKTSPKGHLNAEIMPMRAHEHVCVFYKKLPIYNPQMTHGHDRKVSSAAHKRHSKQSEVYGSQRATSYDSTQRYPISVQVFSSDTQKSRLHPTQKPVALFEYLIKTYTNQGGVVLDNCMGSGTTAIACIITERNYIGFENDEVHYNTSIKRIRDFKGLFG